MRQPKRAHVQSGFQSSLEASKRHHQLTDGPAVPKRGDRFTGALQRIGRADLRRDLAFVPPAEQLLDMRGIGFRVARREGSPEYAADVAALQQRQV
jgi:hypothetical protein